MFIITKILLGYMNSKMMAVVAILVAFSLLAVPQVQALSTCGPEISFTTPSSTVEQFSLFNVKLDTTAPSPATPSLPWLPYTNATLNIDGLTIHNGTSPIDFTSFPVNESASYTWKLNASTSVGSTKLLNLTIQNSTGDSCEKTLSLNVTEATDPILNLITDSLTGLTLPANKPFTYTVNLSNTGNEVATNLLTEVFTSEVNSTKNLTSLTNGSTTSQTFTLTPLTCKQHTLTTKITYFDSVGSSKSPVESTSQIVVNSSDLLLNTFTLSSSSVTEGGAITFTAEVKNIADRNSTGFNVSFYRGSISDANKLAVASSSDQLGFLQSRNVSTAWTSAGTGSATIIAVVDALDGDCDLNNTQKTASLTINAVTNPTTNTGGGNPANTPSPTPTPSPTACTYKWECGDWSVCSPESKQTRTCLNKGTCTGLEGKPEESQSCTFVAIPVEETKKIESLEKDATQTLTFEKDVSIQEISITAKDSITAADLKVKTLISKPTTIQPEVDGKVYKYIEISHTNLEDKVAKATVKFKIEKSWLDSNKIDKNKVVLNRFTDKWDKLSTKLLNEDNTTLVYEAETPGFSVFAISGEELKSEQSSTPGPELGGPTGLIIGGSTLAGIVIVVAVVIAIAILSISNKRKSKYRKR